MRLLKLITFSAVISGCLLAQDSQAPPVKAKRLTPDKSLDHGMSGEKPCIPVRPSIVSCWTFTYL